ncbi:Outer membrane protein transport protein (OMPP1/FadL/TodX) [Candidatus Rubidus massiliensis]|nr:Outer membrane protein transport protein (OMPP1/FadL/TodX) [Candidatus Rubidus massiliensis]
MKFGSVCRYLTISVFGLLCTMSQTTEAILASPKSFGMSAAVIAYPQDAEAAAFNPAGMAKVGDRIDGGGAWVQFYLRSRVRDNLAGLVRPGINGTFVAGRTKNFYNGDFGVNKVVSEDYDISVGLVLYNRNFNKTTYKHPFPLLGTTNLGLEYLHETLSPNVAWSYCRHHFGLSINYNVQRLKVNGIQNFDNPLFSAYPGKVTNKGYSWSQGVGATIGWLYDVTDWFSVGLTYQPRTRMKRFTKYKGFLSHRGRLDIPRKIGFGLAIKVLPVSTVTFDVEHIQWKPVHALSNKLASELTIDKLGTDHGTGFGFKNQTYYRVGMDYDVSQKLTLRAGFRHVNVPFGRTQTAVNLLICDTVEDVITVGATYRAIENGEVSMFYGHGFNKRVNGKRSIPIGLGGGNADLWSNLDVVGLQLSYCF